jgi:ferredoxin--NADP+ reductase
MGHSSLALTAEQVSELRRTRYNATVTWLRKGHPDLMILRVTPDFTLPAHQPGQYSTLGLGNWEPRHPECTPETLNPGDDRKMVRRAYSISCSILNESGQLFASAGANWLEFYIVLVRESQKAQPPGFTPRLFMLKESDRLFLGEKITGHYTLDPVKPGDTVLFLGTGTGEAPHNYMLWELLQRRHTGRILSACCVRYRRDLAYVAIHEELMKRYPHYTYLALTTREADTVQHRYTFKI